MIDSVLYARAVYSTYADVGATMCLSVVWLSLTAEPTAQTFDGRESVAREQAAR